jgi:nitrogenase molybdenum-iron cofactor biosynthesis protein NifN
MELINPKSKIQNLKSLSVNPLKTSPALGAAYALQGIKGAIALFHAAPGCTFLGKVLLTQHLREPVGLLGTDIKEMPTIMGGWDELKKRIADVCEKFKPSLIGVIGTALSEVRGEDVGGVISELSSELKTPNSELLYISAPDYIGGFSEGYGTAVKTIVENLTTEGPKILRQINLLPSPSLTIGDIEEIKDIASAFSLKPIILPDLSLSMDGSKDRFSNLPLDGVTLEEIALMGRSSATIVIGEGLREAGEVLREHFGIPLHIIKGLIGLEATDNFITLLSQLSKRDAPHYLTRWRKRLVDGMVDTHLLLSGKRAAFGLDRDLLAGVSQFCIEMGMIPIADCGLRIAELKNPKSKIQNPKLNDLEDLEDGAEGADLIITSSHGREISERLGIPLLRMGFPVFDRFGEPLKVRAGYRGSLNLLFEMANIFAPVSI